MDSVRVATTHQEGLRPVGTGGQLAVHAYEQLARYLRRTLSEDHVRLLAEPNFNPARGTVDWYTETDDEVLPLAEADPERRQRVEGRLAELRDAVAAKAEALSRSDSGGDRHLGEMLRLALEVPDESAIYCAGDRPVLVSWGTLKDEPDPPRGVLQKFVPYTPPPAAAAAAVGAGPQAMPEPYAAYAVSGAAAAEAEYVERQRPLYWLAWLLWLLFGLLVAAILIVLLSGCGVRLPWFGWAGIGLANYCAVGAAESEPGDAPALRAEIARTQVLEEDLRRLELRVAVARRACERAAAEPSPEAAPAGEEPPGVATEPDEAPADEVPADEEPADEAPAESPSPADQAAFDERMEREGAQRGEITVTLAWDSDADLDLHVICPGGEEIFWNRRSACGGRLDVDMNVPTRMSNEPVENVFWPEGEAPPGTYRIVVENFETRSEDADPTPFRVRIDNDGEVTVHEGTVHESEDGVAVAEFEVQ